MKQYKGLYIDNVIFHSTEEIDNFLKDKAISSYKRACKLFAERPSMERSIYADEKAEYLHKHFGFSYEELEALELEAIA